MAFLMSNFDDFTMTKYRVFLEKVFHKHEEKMQEKIEMTLQKDQNLVLEQLQCGVYF